MEKYKIIVFDSHGNRTDIEQEAIGAEFVYRGEEEECNCDDFEPLSPPLQQLADKIRSLADNS